MLPSVLPRLTSLVFVNFSLFKTPFPGQDSLPGTELPLYLLCLFFHLLYFSYLFLKTMIYFSGCLMSSASIQKLFCRIYSALKYSFDEFVGEKVVSPSYSSAILGPPQCCCSSIAKSCSTLCDLMDCSMPGFPVPYHLPEFAQVHVP